MSNVSVIEIMYLLEQNSIWICSVYKGNSSVATSVTLGKKDTKTLYSFAEHKISQG